MSQRIHKVMYGNTERQTFSKIKDVLDIPYLIEVQKDSYANFIDEGIREVFKDYSPIVDFAGKLKLEFLSHSLTGEPKYSVKECKDRDTTYAIPLRVKTRLTNNDTGEVVEQEVFMGDFPLMTDAGSFVINGAERVIVSQLVRSPGVYSEKSLDKNGTPRYKTTVIPNRGAWLEFEQDQNDVQWVHVDRTRKITATTLLRALGFGTDEELIELFGGDDMMVATCNKDVNCKTEEAGKMDLFRRLRPGEVPTIEGADILINNTFYDNDGALRIGDIYRGELVMLNNLIFANGAGIFGDPSYTVANLRTPIEGYNNIIVGAEQGVNDAIDDECFTSGKAQYNNTVETLATYPLSNVALATNLSTDNFVPYLALTAENSDAVNAGYATGEYADLIPTTDIRGLAVVGTRDIGAYEYGATDPSAISSVVADESDFVIVANGDQISVMNTADRNFTLTVVDMLGRTVYAGNGAGMMTVNKQDIDAHCVIFVLTDGVSKKVQKMMLH